MAVRKGVGSPVNPVQSISPAAINASVRPLR
jgi:hypothetical protein